MFFSKLSKTRIANRIGRNRLLLIEGLETRNLCAGLDDLSAPIISRTAGEGVGEIVEVKLEVRDLANQPIVNNEIPVGESFDLVVSAQDLRANPVGIYSVFQDIGLSNTSAIQLEYGETQRLILPSSFAGSFSLTQGSVTTSDIPFAPLNTLTTRIGNALNTALGTNDIRVLRNAGFSNESWYDIVFEGEFALQNIAPLTVNYSSGGASVIDDFYLADPANTGYNPNAVKGASAFAYGSNLEFAIPFDGLDGVGTFSTNSSLPNNPAELVEIYRLRFQAVAVGEVTVSGLPSSIPGMGISVFGVGTLVPPSLTIYQSLALQIVDAKIAIDDTFTVLEDGGISSLNVLQNDFLSDIDAAVVTNVTQGSAGGSVTIDVASQTINYAPVANFFGEEVFTYTVQDGTEVATATVTITVDPVNDAPIIVSSLTKVSIEDQTLSISSLELLTGVVPGPSNEANQILQVSGVVGASENAGVVSIANGIVTYTPPVNFSGTDTFTIVIRDNGSPEQSVTRTVTLDVQAVNDAPVISNPGTVELLEDEVLSISVGLSAGGNENQVLLVTATSDRKSVLLDPDVGILPGTSSGLMTLRGATNASGSAIVTMVLEDGGLDNNLSTKSDNLRTTVSFTVNVVPVNDPPTILQVANITILEDSAARSIPLMGIGAGPLELQPLRLSVRSSIPAALSNAEVTYVSPAATGNLMLTPAPNAFGEMDITVEVEDGGLDGNLDTLDDNESTAMTFKLSISPVNDSPTMDPLPNLKIEEDSPEISIPLRGISAGGLESQPLRIQVTSSNRAIVDSVLADYISPSTTGQLKFAPKLNASGLTTISVSVEDAGLDLDFATAADNRKTTLTFSVEVTAKNDPPTFDAISDQVVLEDSLPKTITLKGIGAGASESQELRVSATSSNRSLIANPAISYTSPSSTGTLTFVPFPNQSGTSTISLTVEDGGQDGLLSTATDNLKTTKSFTITVTPVNDLPVMNDFATVTIVEDTITRTVGVTGISAGGGEVQPIRVTATSSRPTIIPNPTVNYTSGASGVLVLNPVPNAFGTSVISVVVEDGGLDLNLATAIDNGKTTKTFTVVVTPVNDAPTMDAINNVTLLEDSPKTTVSLKGITAGPGEVQPVRISATSSATSLIPNPTVTYVSGASTGSLSFTPTSNVSGNAVIVVSVEDGGLDGDLTTSLDNAFTRKSFTVSVTPVNDVPTLNPLPNLSINEDAVRQTIPMSGISSGVGERQAIRVTATSSNLLLVANPSVSFNTTTGIGTLSYTPIADESGKSIIVVTVEDAGLDGSLTTTADNLITSRSFTLTVNPVNDLPTLSTIANRTLLEDAVAQSITLTGISTGGDEIQPLRFRAVSQNSLLIPNPIITYVPGSATGVLKYQPIANKSGMAVIVVSLEDGGLDKNLNTIGDNGLVTRTFTVTVSAVNDAPKINPIADRSVLRSSGLQTVSLSGISAGGDETQALRVKVTSNNLVVVPTPSVIYVTPSSIGSLRFTPSRTATGRATITVTVEDAGLDGNFSTINDNLRVIETFVITVR